LRNRFTFPGIQIDPQAKRFAVNASGGRVLVANLDGTEVRTLEGYSKETVLVPVAFSAEGRLVAAAPHTGPKKDKVLRVWDLESGRVNVLGPLAGAGEGFVGGIEDIEFLDEHRLVASGRKEGLQLFDLRNNKSKILSNKFCSSMAISQDRRFILINECDKVWASCKVVRIDLDSNHRDVLWSSEDALTMAMVLDPSDQILLTGSSDGLLRVGRLSGGEPHILFGHEGPVFSVAFSPDGRWIASAARDGKIRLTATPDLRKPAPHTLSYDQFLVKLKSFTNLRVVTDSNSSTGWKLEVGRFPGWQKVPEW
jgi:WD40 repeat protein